MNAKSGFWPRAIGLTGSLLLHVLLLQTFALGSSAKKMPIKQGAGASAIAGDRSPESPLILLQLTDTMQSDEALLQELSSRGMAPKDLPIAVISEDPAPLSANIADSVSDVDPDASITSGDPAGHARLFGLYTGQLQARIERLWRRPRTSVNGRDPGGGGGDEAFRCQAAVRQDAHGRILEILLPHCNGTVAWQRSLVVAIQSASPLPAPPSPTVFSETITLNFVGLGFLPGASADDYEVASPNMASNH